MENRELKMHDKVRITEWFSSGMEGELCAYDSVNNLYTVAIWQMSAFLYPKVPGDIIELISTEDIKEEV